MKVKQFIAEAQRTIAALQNDKKATIASVRAYWISYVSTEEPCLAIPKNCRTKAQIIAHLNGMIGWLNGFGRVQPYAKAGYNDLTEAHTEALEMDAALEGTATIVMTDDGQLVEYPSTTTQKGNIMKVFAPVALAVAMICGTPVAQAATFMTLQEKADAIQQVRDQANAAHDIAQLSLDKFNNDRAHWTAADSAIRNQAIAVQQGAQARIDAIQNTPAQPVTIPVAPMKRPPLQPKAPQLVPQAVPMVKQLTPPKPAVQPQRVPQPVHQYAPSLPGRDGHDGHDGAAGATGATGAAGAPGNDGKPGSNGRDGRNGVTTVVHHHELDTQARDQLARQGKQIDDLKQDVKGIGNNAAAMSSLHFNGNHDSWAISTGSYNADGAAFAGGLQKSIGDHVATTVQASFDAEGNAMFGAGLHGDF